MRLINIILVLAVSFSLASAGEATLDFDQVAYLAPTLEESNTVSSRIAIHFALPEALDGAEILYAEIFMPIDLSNIHAAGDLTLEIMARDITTEWTEEDADWSSPWDETGGDLDSLSFYSYTFTLADADEIHMDITEYVKSIAAPDAYNFGLMLMPVKHDQNVFHLPRYIVSLIKNSAQIKIIYE